jgi:hypothetical protein
MLAELSRPKARRLDPDVACQRARVAGVRYHARVCHVAALIHPPPCPAHLHARLLLWRHCCCALLRARARLLCTTLSCPFSPRACAAALSRHLPLSLLTQARVASTQFMAIKGGHLCISSTTAPCSPLVSRHRRIASIFLPLRRCQAASPHLSPRAQVLELRKAPELLLV